MKRRKKSLSFARGIWLFNLTSLMVMLSFFAKFSIPSVAANPMTPDGIISAEEPSKPVNKPNTSAKEKNDLPSVSDTKKDRIKDDWKLTLVNKSHVMDKGYKPKLTTVEDGYEFDSRGASALTAMLSDMRKAGLNPKIISAYRTTDYQNGLYKRQVKKWQDQGYAYKDALEKAKTVVAYPGTSEHNLGLAVDLVSRRFQNLTEAQAKTAEAKWLKDHCAEYGFILRYPTDKSDITGVIFEPWHFRYVGKEVAKEIMDKGIVLEEYLDEVENLAYVEKTKI